MNDTDFLKQLIADLKTAAWDADDIDRLWVVIEHIETLETLEQGYKVIEDTSREAQDRWEDRSE